MRCGPRVRPHLFAALAIPLALLAAPLAAQTSNAGSASPASQTPAPTPAPSASPTPSGEASLQDLIPDSAVSNAKGWAGSGNAPTPSPSRSAPSPLPATTTPIQPIPLATAPNAQQIDLGPIQPLAPDAQPIQFDTFGNFLSTPHFGKVEHLGKGVELVFPRDTAGFPQHDAFVSRFRSLSTIESLSHGDNIGRLAAQARSDQQLLQRLLHVYGYYNGQVSHAVDATNGQLVARFDIVPGPRYAFGTIDLGDLSAAGPDYPALRRSFAIETGDPLSLDAIVQGRTDLSDKLGNSGYPFADIADPSLLVDHDKRTGDLTMTVTPHGKYVFGKITSNLPRFLSGKHLQHLARWKPGQVYQRSEETDLRKAILATGIVGSVSLVPTRVTPPSADKPGTVDIAATMTKAPLRTVAGSIGYGTEEGVRVAGSWEDRSLFPPEGSLKLRGILGTQEQLAGITLTKHNFHARDRIASIDAFAHYVRYTAYTARTLSLVGTYQRVSTLLFQKPLSYSAGLELVATSERQFDANGQLGPPQGYYVAALPLFGQIDTTDNLLDPTHGYRLALRLSPETSNSNGVQSFYLRAQGDASAYQPVGKNVVFAGRVRVASITGASTADIAPSRRLYAGGGGSVRGYGYEAIGPRDTAGDPIGGRSLLEFSAEARIRTGLLGHTIGFVPFVDAGTVGDGPVPGFRHIQVGAGIGLRYYSTFGPIRVDVATPLNPGPNDPPIAVYVALGQAF